MTAGRRLEDWLAATASALSAAGVECPRREARLLFRLVAGEGGSGLVAASGTILSQEEIDRLDAVAARRLAREPLSRIRGTREFWGRDFLLSPETLDPRPETETLVEAVLQSIAVGGHGRGPLRILDLGTGTGALIVTLLAELPTATGVGTDISEEALAVARQNARRQGIEGRASFMASDWLASVEGTYHIIVSNPPYIRRSEIAGLEPEVMRFDPLRGLDGGEDGLDAYRRIIGSARPHLDEEGGLFLEVGAGQAGEVAMLLDACGLTTGGRQVVQHKDLAQHVRVVACAAHGALQDEITVGISGATR